jgi:RNA polymerase sigma-B factor
MEAFLHAHLSRRQNANDITRGTHDPSEPALGERPHDEACPPEQRKSSPRGITAPTGRSGASQLRSGRQVRPMSRQAPPGLRQPTRHRSRTSGSAGRSALGGDELRELFARWQQDRDRAARDELIERFLPLARSLARRYTGAHEPFEDLVQVASYGLLKALDRFDLDRGTAFSSFAVPTIVGELRRYFRDLGWSAHVPRGAQELALKVHSAQEKLTTRTGRSPTVAELAQYLELSIEDVLEGLEAAAAHHSSSLDLPHDDGDGGSGTLADTFGHEDAGFQLVDDATTVATAMQTLSERERQVLRLRFFQDRTQSEIARQIGVSQMQISRILRRAITALNELTLPGTPVADEQSPA